MNQTTNTTAGIDLGKLEALIREYGNTPVLSIGRGRSDILAEIKELARRPTSGSDVAAPRMTYDEFFAEAKRLGCKLPPELLLPASGSDFTVRVDMERASSTAHKVSVSVVPKSRKLTQEEVDALDCNLWASGSDGTTASVAVREGAWDWKQRAEAAEAFIKPYADANNEYLAGDYSVQPMVRRLAAAILEWQTDVLKHAPDDVCGVETEASGSELVKLKAAIDSTFPETDSAHTSVQMRRTDQRNAFRLGWEQARAAVAQQAGAPALLNADELAELRRFNETCEDGEGYDVPKEMMRRLTAIGAVEWKGFSRYQITAFGMHVLGAAPAPAAQDEQDAKDAARSYLEWWTSIETDVRKSILVFAHREPERLHALVKQAYEEGQQSVHAAMSQSKTQGTADKDGAA